MKNKGITPSKHERVMREEDFIVSKTDLKGRITYCNEIFIEFSGYSEQELLGSQHNIIRHPDMPRAAFKLVWDTIQNGQEIFAYVKNMSKDGGFYWVFTHITPDFDLQNRIIGYYSVRRYPHREAIAAVEALYRTMLDAEHQAGSRDAIAAGAAVLENALHDADMSYEQFIFSL